MDEPQMIERRLAGEMSLSLSQRDGVSVSTKRCTVQYVRLAAEDVWGFCVRLRD